MPNFTKVFIVVVLILASFQGFSQPRSGNYQILLKSGTQKFPENAQDFIKRPQINPQEIVNGTYYRLVQFYQIPKLNDRERIIGTGLNIIEYIPHKTFVIAFPANYDLKKLSSYGVRSIMPINTMYKINPRLMDRSFPDWALEENKLKVVVKYHPNLSRTSVVKMLTRLGYAEITKTSPRSTLISLLIPTDKVYDLAENPFIAYIEMTDPPAVPDDTRGKSLHRANVLNSEFASGRKYDGTGVNVQVRDDGIVGPHIDYQGRINNIVQSDAGTHGDGVGGIMSGAGNLNPTIQGMAPGSFVYVTNYVASFLDTTLGLHINNDVMITNSSYSNGCNAGYTAITQTVDGQGYDYPNLLHVFSAGNSGASNCGYGAGSFWGNITGGHKQGKNVIATANLRANDSLENSSSRGPAHDGRIKPDISANGFQHLSTAPNNGYLSFGGTSGAAPGIAGVAAQLYQAYKELNGGTVPEAALIKATILNSAYDLGNDGPDFKYGWGRIDGNQAIKIIEGNQIMRDSIGQGGMNTHSITVPANTKEVRIMTYWPDPPASLLAGIALINDINTTVTTPGGTTENPWILNSVPNATTLNDPATKGVDNLNNMEQVLIENPAAGIYTLNVDGFAIPNGMQNYFVVYTFIPDEVVMTYPLGGEGFVPFETERLRWDGYGRDVSFGTFSLDYTTDNGMTWTNIASNIDSDVRFYDWVVPNDISGEARVRVTRGTLTDESDANFSIIGITTVTLDQVCPDFATISWNEIPGATGYEISKLGAKYMDSVATIAALPNPSFFVPSPITEETWFAVRAIGPKNLKGRRSLAIFKAGGQRIACPINDDVGISLNSSTLTGPFIDCRNYSILVQVELKNEGSTPISGIPVSYQLNSGTVVSDTFAGTLTAGTTANFTFGTNVNINDAGINQLKTWAQYPTDTVGYNDTSNLAIEVQQSVLVTLPVIEDFEGFQNCGTTINCGEEVCALGNGWINSINGVEDGIDWRVNSGNTPSGGTGPSLDHKPGNINGKYIYLEASGGCNGEVASLVSPCIDLTGITQGELSLWYHMFGATMGELHIDFDIGNGWINDFVPPIVGDQGNSWQQLTIDLSAFNGFTVNFRIRGITGFSFTSDLALDDIIIYNRAGPPVVDFSANNLNVCPNDVVQLSDLSFNNPLAWEWVVTPNTIQYQALTNANSQNPILSFLAEGKYEVKLIATNANGSDSTIKTQYITVESPTPLDVVENFETTFPPAGWQIINNDGDTTWNSIQVTGLSGSLTNAAFINHYSYPNSGEIDELLSMPLDLTTADQPYIIFDVAYAQFNVASADQLQVEVGNGCTPFAYAPIYAKSGSILATVPPLENPFFPNDASQWRKDTVNLTAFVGTTVKLKFSAVNDFGNNLFIDNIQIIDIGNPKPNAEFESTDDIICEGSPITLTDMSIGTGLTYNWDFGQDASPATATTAGPHNVVFNSPGPKIITLTVNDASGTNANSVSKVITVDPLPDPDFTFSTVGSVYKFENNTVNGNTYYWDFGNGDTSTMAEPQYKYTVNGSYDIMLIAFNDCGPDTIIQTVDVINVSVENLLENASIKVFPNPNQGIFELEINSSLMGELEVSVFDTRGRVLKQFDFEKNSQVQNERLDISELTSGVYLLKVGLAGEVGYLKVMLDR